MRLRKQEATEKIRKRQGRKARRLISKNDLKHGQGKYTYGNGDVYKGQWHEGKRQGKGVYIYKENGGQ